METGRPAFEDAPEEEVLTIAALETADGFGAKSEVEASASVSETDEASDNDSDFDPTDPAEKVEAFLQDSAKTFAEGQRQWRTIRQIQGTILQNAPVSLIDMLKEGGVSRRDRRQQTIRKIANGNWQSIITDTQNQAEEYYKTKLSRHLDQKHSKDEEGQRACLEDIIEEHPPYKTPEDTNDEAKVIFERFNDLHATVLRATYFDEIAYDRVDTFFKEQNPEVVKAFMTRLEGLADDEFLGYNEFPGLLESFAVHIRKAGPVNLLTKAIKKIAPEPSELSADFIRSVIDNSEENKRTDLTMRFMVFGAKVALGVTHDTENEEWRTDLAERFGRQVDNWPPELTKELSIYAVKQQNNYAHGLTDKLGKYLHQGRASGMRLASGVSGKKRLASAKSASSETSVSASASDTAVPETAATPEKPKAIERFATFKNPVMSKNTRNRLMPVECASIDELLGSKMITEYLKKYQSDPNLSETLRQAFTQLTEAPFDRTSTRRMVHAEYTLDVDDGKRQRNMRRMSLQRLPGVDKSSISAKTRILYDVLDQRGEPQLAVYGVFFKQGVENVTELPRR
jgi:hypothetical protein